jgi:hypothetical protein
MPPTVAVQISHFHPAARERRNIAAAGWNCFGSWQLIPRVADPYSGCVLMKPYGEKPERLFYLAVQRCAAG